LAIDTLGRVVFFRAGITVIVWVFATKDAARLAFAGFTDMAHPITRKAYFNFRNEGKYFVTITTETDIFWKNLSCEFEAHSKRRNLVSPSTLILLFKV